MQRQRARALATDGESLASTTQRANTTRTTTITRNRLDSSQGLNKDQYPSRKDTRLSQARAQAECEAAFSIKTPQTSREYGESMREKDKVEVEIESGVGKVSAIVYRGCEIHIQMGKGAHFVGNVESRKLNLKPRQSLTSHESRRADESGEVKFGIVSDKSDSSQSNIPLNESHNLNHDTNKRHSFSSGDNNKFSRSKDIDQLEDIGRRSRDGQPAIAALDENGQKNIEKSHQNDNITRLNIINDNNDNYDKPTTTTTKKKTISKDQGVENETRDLDHANKRIIDDLSCISITNDNEATNIESGVDERNEITIGTGSSSSSSLSKHRRLRDHSIVNWRDSQVGLSAASACVSCLLSNKNSRTDIRFNNDNNNSNDNESLAKEREQCNYLSNSSERCRLKTTPTSTQLLINNHQHSSINDLNNNNHNNFTNYNSTTLMDYQQQQQQQHQMSHRHSRDMDSMNHKNNNHHDHHNQITSNVDNTTNHNQVQAFDSCQPSSTGIANYPHSTTTSGFHHNKSTGELIQRQEQYEIEARAPTRRASVGAASSNNEFNWDHDPTDDYVKDPLRHSRTHSHSSGPPTTTTNTVGSHTQEPLVVEVEQQQRQLKGQTASPDLIQPTPATRTKRRRSTSQAQTATNRTLIRTIINPPHEAEAEAAKGGLVLDSCCFARSTITMINNERDRLQVAKIDSLINSNNNNNKSDDDEQQQKSIIVRDSGISSSSSTSSSGSNNNNNNRYSDTSIIATSTSSSFSVSSECTTRSETTNSRCPLDGTHSSVVNLNNYVITTSEREHEPDNDENGDHENDTQRRGRDLDSSRLLLTCCSNSEFHYQSSSGLGSCSSDTLDSLELKHQQQTKRTTRERKVAPKSKRTRSKSLVLNPNQISPTNSIQPQHQLTAIPSQVSGPPSEGHFQLAAAQLTTSITHEDFNQSNDLQNQHNEQAANSTMMNFGANPDSNNFHNYNYYCNNSNSPICDRNYNHTSYNVDDTIDIDSGGSFPQHLAQSRQHQRQDSPRVYPNNTLMADLSKCHANMIHLWPQFQLQLTYRRLVSSLKRLGSNRKRARQDQDKVEKMCHSVNNVNHFHHCAPIAINRASVMEAEESSSISIKEQQEKLTFQMPDSLLRARVKLKREDYDRALSILTRDIRFKLHLLLYGRIQAIWLLLSTALCLLIPSFLVMSPELLLLGASSALWLLLQVAGTYVAFSLRRSLNRVLESAVAQVNSFFMDHNLMLGVINMGSLLTRSKLMVPLLYFDTTPCRLQIEAALGNSLNNSSNEITTPPSNSMTPDSACGTNNKQKSTTTSSDDNKQQQKQLKPIDEATTKGSALALAKSQLAKKIVLKYSQRWISEFDRRKLAFSADSDAIVARHLSTGKCLCQFFEEQLLLESGSKSGGKNPNTANTTTHNSDRFPIISDQHPEQDGKVSSPIGISVITGAHRDHEHKDQYSKGNPEKRNNSEKIILRQQTLRLESSGVKKQAFYNTNNDELRIDMEPQGVMDATPVSLELGVDECSISRSDDLIRKLRLFLSLRTNELQALDGQLFSPSLPGATNLNSLNSHSHALGLKCGLPLVIPSSPDSGLGTDSGHASDRHPEQQVLSGG